MSSHSRQLTQAESDEIQREFEEYDKDKNGFVSLQEAEEVLGRRFGFNRAQAEHYLKICDTNNDGQLSYTEFIEFYHKIKEKIAEIQAVFNKFDVNHDGVVSLEEAKAAMKGLKFSEAEIEALVDTYDVNKDGMLQYDEFVKFWMGK